MCPVNFLKLPELQFPTFSNPTKNAKPVFLKNFLILNVRCPLKGHTNLNKPTAFRCRSI